MSQHVSGSGKRKAWLWIASAVVAMAAVSPSMIPVRADDAPAAPAAEPAVLTVADQMYRAIKDHDLARLKAITIPATDPNAAKLTEWKDNYIHQIEFTDKQRTEQYDKEVGQAQEASGKGNFEKAIAEVVAAHDIARDKDLFLKLDWVQDITAKTAAKAAEYEKAGRWIESLQLYNDLNTLFDIDTRYKADMQRLARRTRLLALYVPQELYAQRKAIIARENAEDKATESATQPATQASTQPAGAGAATQTAGTQPAGTEAATQDADDMPSFSRWQDQVENITPDMLHEALSDARNNWVEQTSYEALMRGGVEALRLFLTTPELAKEFPALADPVAKAKFEGSLNAALAKIQPDEPLTIGQLDDAVNDILQTNDSSIKLPVEVITMEFTDGAMEKLDPFTAVIWPHEADEFYKNTRGSFGGVGIQISLENGQLKVISPLEDTPAYKEGIQAGDVITAIDGKSTVGISIDSAVHQIMGAPETDVTLRIKREAQSFDKTLTRAIIQVKSVKGFIHQKDDETKWNFMIDPDSRIGYIRITGFQELTAKELEDALVELQAENVRGIVLDLRFNPGGLLGTAVKMCDMFLDRGTIVSTRGRVAKPTKQVADEKTSIPMNMPLIVMVNQYSASASEIFSGAMKDLDRGLIVGERSFGKGSVQNLIDLKDKASMKLTVAYYYLPNGESLHRRDGSRTWGVEPDVKVELTPEQVTALLKARRDSEIIHGKGEAAPVATTQSATQKKEEPVYDTQLETALLLMRLQLIQQKP